MKENLVRVKDIFENRKMLFVCRAARAFVIPYFIGS